MANGWTGVDPTAWAESSDKLMTALLRNAVQDLATVASTTIPNGGRVPVKTGNLARSVVVDNKPPTVIEGLAQSGGFSAGIAAIKPGETVYIGWQAKYSMRVNYGFVGADSLGRVYNQTGYGFAEAAAAQWPAIVKRQTIKLGAR